MSIAGLRQVADDVVRRVLHPLHEDVVVDLLVPLVRFFVGARRASVRPELGATVDVDLTARTARTGDAHLPEVVLFRELDDALGGQSDLLRPDVDRFLVALEHAREQAIGVDLEDLGHDLEGPRDRLILEVVAEREVAEHLEERAVLGVRADVFDVLGSEALLHRCRPRERSWLLTEQVPLERHHPRDGEHQRWIVRDQRCRRDHAMTALLVEAQERPTDLVDAHRARLPAEHAGQRACNGYRLRAAGLRLAAGLRAGRAATSAGATATGGSAIGSLSVFEENESPSPNTTLYSAPASTPPMTGPAK